MTVDKRAERNADLVRRYLAGESLELLGRDFHLTRGRIFQILKKLEVPRNRQNASPERDQFLGVNLSETVKDALRAEAGRRGISMSALSSDLLKEMLISCGYQLEAEQVAP